MEKLYVFLFNPEKAYISVAELNDNFLFKGFRIHTIVPYEKNFLIFLIKETEEKQLANNEREQPQA